ncbi:amino acid-binding protein [Anaerotardibacter muris]|uniref:amino acid-binding protein n=1 Tax=Anaerotardibacter muris TaxID=2941505 RepID=UPI002040F600|nr:amino acid-binding protein [Anaerotardibacter muris]
MISQLTVFLENREGHLASAVRTIASADINMQAMFLADTKDFGILRIFCDTPEKACKILKDEGYQARLVDVVAVKVDNVPGALSKLFDYLDSKDVNVEYAHCFIVGDHAIDILKVNDPALDVKLAAEGFEVCKPEDVYLVD